ncbi:MAG: type I restriction enzyme HsdR N-terminal domain-containing protein [Bacteroidetes bacterium]|nr:type I restriction enzyme HsdR N-terminal domain-containing protein [Bacteroidota bacterium]MDA1268039.1 type I restriction enzyme HsdR N-terminal domain-containing protein [Bacteroidota bacterium]
MKKGSGGLARSLVGKGLFCSCAFISIVITLPELNLPAIEPQLVKKGVKVFVFDLLRKKNILLTPEEWVRQHWIHFLILSKGFPKGLVTSERGLIYNGLQKRTDLLVFDRQGAPYFLIECKAPEVEINQKVLSQALAYNQTLKCPFIALSNGNRHIFMGYVEAEERYAQQLTLPPIP